jgi:hypothetical protein
MPVSHVLESEAASQRQGAAQLTCSKGGGQCSGSARCCPGGRLVVTQGNPNIILFHGAPAIENCRGLLRGAILTHGEEGWTSG